MCHFGQVAELKKRALSELKSLPKAVPADEQKAWVNREIRFLATELQKKAEAKHREKAFYHSVHALFAAFTAEVGFENQSCITDTFTFCFCACVSQRKRVMQFGPKYLASLNHVQNELLLTCNKMCIMLKHAWIPPVTSLTSRLCQGECTL